MFHRIALAGVLSLLAVAVPRPAVGQPKTGTYPDSRRFEKEIQAFEAQDAHQRPPQGAILCLGSSSMKGWHATIRQDLAPLTVVPRGFGGSNMHDALYYANRVVLPYKPRAIVLYEGDNDTAQGISPEKIRDTFRAFVAKVHRDLPQTRIYFLSIKPSPRRWKIWPTAVKANELISAECQRDPKLHYVDVAGGMLRADGQVRPEIFGPDQLHMNRNGYVIWTKILRPELLKGELRFEKAPVAEPGGNDR